MKFLDFWCLASTFTAFQRIPTVVCFDELLVNARLKANWRPLNLTRGIPCMSLAGSCDPFGCSKKLKDCMPLLRCCLFPNIAWFAAVAIQAVENQSPLRQWACQKSIRKHVSFSSQIQTDSCLLSLRIGAPLLTSPHPCSRVSHGGMDFVAVPQRLTRLNGRPRWQQMTSRPRLQCPHSVRKAQQTPKPTWMGIMAATIFWGMRTWPEAGFLMLFLGGFSLVLYILFGEFCFDQQRLTFVFCSCQVLSRGDKDNWKVWWWPLEEVRKEGEGRIPYMHLLCIVQ